MLLLHCGDAFADSDDARLLSRGVELSNLRYLLCVFVLSACCTSYCSPSACTFAAVSHADHHIAVQQCPLQSNGASRELSFAAMPRMAYHSSTPFAALCVDQRTRLPASSICTQLTSCADLLLCTACRSCATLYIVRRASGTVRCYLVAIFLTCLPLSTAS